MERDRTPPVVPKTGGVPCFVRGIPQQQTGGANRQIALYVIVSTSRRPWLP
jgi:hypothetical protein